MHGATQIGLPVLRFVQPISGLHPYREHAKCRHVLSSHAGNGRLSFRRPARAVPGPGASPEGPSAGWCFGDGRAPAACAQRFTGRSPPSARAHRSRCGWRGSIGRLPWNSTGKWTPRVILPAFRPQSRVCRFRRSISSTPIATGTSNISANALMPAAPAWRSAVLEQHCARGYLRDALDGLPQLSGATEDYRSARRGRYRTPMTRPGMPRGPHWSIRRPYRNPVATDRVSLRMARGISACRRRHRRSALSSCASTSGRTEARLADRIPGRSGWRR